jgi:chromate transporter
VTGGPDAEAPDGIDAPAPQPASPAQLFRVFSGLALRGFGGVLPWAQRVLVEERRWLTRDQFVELLAFGQLLPGPNICNLAIMAGDRWFGWRGALAALGGLLAGPTAIVLALAALYAGFAEEPAVRRALAGMAAVAAGLIAATALKLAATQAPRWLAVGLLAFVGVGLLRWPLAWVVAALGPPAVALAWAGARRARGRPAAPGTGRGGGAAR